MSIFFNEHGLEILLQVLLLNDYSSCGQNSTVIRDTLWVLSNVACDSVESAKLLVSHNIFSIVVKKMASHVALDCRSEAIITVGNLLWTLPPETTLALLQDGNQDLIKGYL